MPRCKVAPSDAAYRTPKKFTTKRSNHEGNNESSPEKRECPFSPGTIAAEELEKLSVSTPNLRSRRLASASPARHKSPGRQHGKNLFKSQETNTEPRSASRGRGRPRKNPISSPQAVFKILPETDANLEMECEEDGENIPPEQIAKTKRGRPKKKLFVGKKEEKEIDEKMEIDQPSSSSQAVLKIQPIVLKRVDLKTYRISFTPRDSGRARPRLANRNPKLFDSDYEASSSSPSEEEDDSDFGSNSRSPSPVHVRRNKKSEKFVDFVPKTLEQLRGLLHTSEIPDKMPCREREFEEIRRFIVEGVKPDSLSQAMYISGVPGTGKTATTISVIKEVAKKYKFNYVTVNAMELMEPINLFSEIYKSIIDAKRISPQNARKKLNAMFERADKKRLPLVILIDELDMLCTKKQDIFYDIFNWTSCETARVSVITIANTLDLPERVMSQRISSRLGTNRVVFQPYTYEQIEEIIRARLSRSPQLVQEQAVVYVSKLVSNVSGDLRKAMDLLRRGIEIAVERGEKEQLVFEHVRLAQKESAAASRNILGENLSLHGFILFRAALCQVQSSGVEEFQFYELYKQYRVLCTNLEGVNPLNDYSIRRILLELTSNRLLVASPVVNFMRQRIRLGMLTNDALFVIKQVEDARKDGKIVYY